MPKPRTQLKYGEGKIHMEVFVGVTNNVKHIITQVVNEFQVRVANKRAWENGNNNSDWLIETSSLYY